MVINIMIIKKIIQKLKTIYNNRIKSGQISGIAIVEFAAIIGIMIPAFTGVFDVGMMTFMRSQMQYAADYGARVAMTGVNQVSNGSAGSVSILQSNISNMMSLNGTNVTTTIQTYPSFANAMYMIPPAAPTVGNPLGCWDPNTGIDPSGSNTLCTYTPLATGFSTSNGTLQSGTNGVGLQSQAAVYQLTYTYNPITPLLSPSTITVYSAAINNPTF
jgi:Flp pilus assembly protein TadG